MNKTSTSKLHKNNQSPNQSMLSTTNNALASPKKQFPSISLSKHLQDYKAYRSIDNKKKYPDIDKNNNYTISPQQKSILLKNIQMRNIQMPSIHNANQISHIDGLLNRTQNKIQKLQYKVLKSLLTTKREQEWKLYIKKSQLLHEKNNEFDQIEEYLLKFISKCVDKSIIHPNSLMNNEINSEQKQQNSHIGLTNIDNNENNKKNNRSSNSFLQTSNYFGNNLNANNNNTLNKVKSSQPSLKMLKDQLNTLSNSKDASIIDHNSSMLNKTSTNFNNKHDNLIQKITHRFQQEINKLTFDRSLLEKKLELYVERIKQLQNRLKEENINIDEIQGNEETQTNQQVLQASNLSSLNSSNMNLTNLLNSSTPATNKPSHKKKILTTQQIMMSNLINQNKYKSQAQFKKIQNQTLLKQLSMIKQYSFKLKLDNQKLTNQIIELQKQCEQCRQYKKYKQLWLMQSEEMIEWKFMFRQKKEELAKLYNKIKILKQKNKQLLHSFNFSMVVNPDQEEDKQQLENIIKGFQQWLRVISVPRLNPIIDPKSLLEDNGIKQQQYMPNPQNINYKLLKPNFFIFFQAYQKTIMMEKNILNTRPLQPTFYVKIRAILDSMYNHFNSYGHYKNWTSFPQFVIGFLQKYQISQVTMKMQQRKKSMSSEEKLTFLMNLFNKKLSNTWQCDLFRSFILQQYTLDQIYFYLDCRNDLNGGSTLTHGFGRLDPVNYVKLSKALSTAQKKLFPYENYIIQRVKSIIKSRKKQKNGQMFIDRHFVLKLLLEVYSLQKIKSQRIFQASFKTKNNKKSIISYSDYLSFMTKNFDFLTTIDICELYRQTYSLSSGKITHKSIHYVCQSKGLFIPLIWSKRLNMNILQKSLNNDMILLDIQNNVRKMSIHIQQLGIQQINRLENDINYFLRQIDWYRNNKQVFYYKLQQIKIKILKSNCILDWQASTYTPNELLTTDQIRQSILQLHHLLHESNSSVKLLSSKKQQKQKAIKQITRNFKIRIQQSMKQFKRVDDQQLRKLKQQVTLEIKMRQLRQKSQTLNKQQPLNSNKLSTNNNKQQQLQQKQQTKKNIVGNSFANVNDMLMDKINVSRMRNNKINEIKSQMNNQKGVKSMDHRFSNSRKQNKLPTISQANENV